MGVLVCVCVSSSYRHVGVQGSEWPPCAHLIPSLAEVVPGWLSLSGGARRNDSHVGRRNVDQSGQGS